MNIKKNKLVKICIIVLLLLLFFVFLNHKIVLSTNDLGRHLANGKLVFDNPKILHSNFYSLGYENFEFVNHHWLSGVLFYWVYLIGGFNLLVILKIILMLSLFLLIFYIASKKSSFWIAAAVSFPMIFILSERTGVRPEIFSYLFTTIFLYILYDFSRKQENKNFLQSKKIWVLPIIQLLWVNLHSYFFIGLGIMGAFIIQDLIKNKKQALHSQHFRTLIKVGIATVVATLINPNFLKGAIYPFLLFGKLAYPIAECQSPFIIYLSSINPNISIYFFMLALFAITFFLALKKQTFVSSVLSIFAILVSILMLRNLALFAIIALPLMSYNLYNLRFKKKYFTIVIIALLILVPVISMLKYPDIIFPKEKGLGITEYSSSAADFFNKNNLSGNVFNNLNLGNYIIFYHFPKVRVFVDGRPEAYPPAFLENYIKMQMDENEWNKNLEKFNFSIIYFQHQERTHWAMGFLKNMVNSETWGVIYADRYSMILVRKDIYPSFYENRITSENVDEKLKQLLNSKNPEVLRCSVSVVKLFNRYDLALDIYTRLLEKYPKDIGALMGTATLLAASEEKETLKEAANYFERAISAGYSKSIAYNKLGLVYFNLGEYDKAEKSWRRALLHNPFDKTTKNYLNQFEKLKHKSMKI